MLKVKKNAIIFDGYRVKSVWTAPELFAAPAWADALSPYVDVYSFGLIAWQILSRQVPFDGKVARAALCVR